MERREPYLVDLVAVACLRAGAACGCTDRAATKAETHIRAQPTGTHRQAHVDEPGQHLRAAPRRQLAALGKHRRMLPEERAQYRRRRSERRRSEGSNMSSSPQSDPSTEWAHQQMARLRSRVEAQRRDAAAEAGSPTGDRLSKLLDRALQGPATPASPREAPEQLRTEAATLKSGPRAREGRRGGAEEDARPRGRGERRRAPPAQDGTRRARADARDGGRFKR